MIQHGAWLEATPWIANDDLCIFTDSDGTLQRGLEDTELSRLAAYDTNTIGLGQNEGPDDTLWREAARLDVPEHVLDTYGSWQEPTLLQLWTYRCEGLSVSSITPGIRGLAQDFHTRVTHRSRCQWLICYLVAKEHWKVDKLEPSVHANGHFGIPEGCTYDKAGQVCYNNRIVFFRHVL